jgi:glutathione S-transferase
MTPTITAFERSPDRGRGLARDMRVRWALEEAGQPYEVRLVSFSEMKESAHRALHPFGQIPTYEDGDLTLYESGAIVFHIAERHAGLLPDDANARARAITWMFAALSTVEPPILDCPPERCSAASFSEFYLDLRIGLPKRHSWNSAAAKADGRTLVGGRSRLRPSSLASQSTRVLDRRCVGGARRRSRQPGRSSSGGFVGNAPSTVDPWDLSPHDTWLSMLTGGSAASPS